MKGYAGTILRVDLFTDSCEAETLPSTWPRKFLGGMGFASVLLFEEVDSDLDALDPTSKLVVAPGVLTGMGIPTASKMLFLAKSHTRQARGWSPNGVLTKAKFTTLDLPEIADAIGAGV